MYNIVYNGKHSFNDFGLKRFNSKEHKAPSKNKIYETVPFMNGSYDFSNIYGGNTYSDRELTYSFLVEVENEDIMNYKKIAIENWFLGTNEKTMLIDEDLKGYYYMAECIDIDFDNYYSFGLIDVTFTAYPFKIGESYEGNTIWDNFNFELDVLQDTKFNISGSNDISIYNSSATNIIPSVICSSSMEVIKGNTTYKFNPGTSKDYRFELSIGENNMTVKGNGSIEFKFRKEVL